MTDETDYEYNNNSDLRNEAFKLERKYSPSTSTRLVPLLSSLWREAVA